MHSIVWNLCLKTRSLYTETTSRPIQYCVNNIAYFVAEQSSFKLHCVYRKLRLNIQGAPIKNNPLEM